jgi:hypothetical protein
MAYNKISALQPPVDGHFVISLPPGGTYMIPPGQTSAGMYGSVTTPQQGAGQNMSGQYLIGVGRHSTLQVYDAHMQYWRSMGALVTGLVNVSADGASYRIANTTGCPVGAIITNAGSGLTNGFNTVAVTPSAGGSVWSTIVGGAINTTITITAGGTLYTAAPKLAFVPPASQGSTPFILPTAVCTISGGAINAVTVVNQGAGLVAAPTVVVIPAVGDTTGGGAVLTVNTTLAGSGTLLAMYPAANTTATSGIPVTTPYGTVQTSVPTFTFSPASTIAATAIMNFTITGFTNTAAGVGYVNAAGVFTGGVVAGSAANTNPVYDKGLGVPVWPPINVAATTGVPTLAGPFQGVNIQAVPTYTAVSATSVVSTVAQQPPTVGGTNSTTHIISI